MNGFLFPESGEVRVCGMSHYMKKTYGMIRSQMGMVFQNPDNQFVGATVQDDVAFGLENNGVPYEDMVVACHESLATSEDGPFLNQ